LTEKPNQLKFRITTNGEIPLDATHIGELMADEYHEHGVANVSFQQAKKDVIATIDRTEFEQANKDAGVPETTSNLDIFRIQLDSALENDEWQDDARDKVTVTEIAEKKKKKPKQAPEDAARELAQALPGDAGAQLTATTIDGQVIRFNPMISHWRDEAKPDRKLIRDIEEHGQLQTIVMRKLPDGSLELIAGHRRFEALLTLKTPFKDMKVEIRENISDIEAVLMAISENKERKDLNRIEEARTYQSLIKLGLDSNQISQKLHVGESTVRERLTLLELPAEVQKAMLKEEIPYSCARALVKLNGYPEIQTQMAKKFCGSSAESYQSFRPWSAEAAEKSVDEILEQIRLKKEFIEKYAPCPKCQSTKVRRETTYDKENQVRCEKCNYLYDGKTRMPWIISAITEKAAEVGLKTEVKIADGTITISPEEVAQIITKREDKTTAPEEQVSPTIRSTNNVTDLAMFLQRANGILSFTLNDSELNVKLAENTNLFFTAQPHDYKEGNLTKITTIEEQWSSEAKRKLKARKPLVEQFLTAAKEQLALNPNAIGTVQCVSCDSMVPYKQAIPHRAEGSLQTEIYCQKCAVIRGLAGNVPDSALNKEALAERERLRAEKAAQ
jgi:ParB/RepB/Spo0J family partition protein